MKKITIYDLLPLLKKGWVAMDENVSWFWHENKPKIEYDVDCGGIWSPHKGLSSEIPYCFNIAPFEGSWKDSLIKVEHKEEE